MNSTGKSSRYRTAPTSAATTTDERDRRSPKRAELKAYEAVIGFDPGNNDDDFLTLMRDLGYTVLSQIEVPN